MLIIKTTAPHYLIQKSTNKLFNPIQLYHSSYYKIQVPMIIYILFPEIFDKIIYFLLVYPIIFSIPTTKIPILFPTFFVILKPFAVLKFYCQFH